MSIPNAPVAVGQILAGKYRTERLLGVGGMGVVVEATHLDLQKRVALKFLVAHGPSYEAMVERFLREARAAVHLKSQHVAQVSDVGRFDSGAPYMVMEMLEGRDLDAVVMERGPMPIAEAVEYVLHACEAVAEAHREGIVHRDLKPANLFLTTGADGSPMVKVLDFGVSKFTAAQQMKLTADGQAVGSPLYMSPEQTQASEDVDARSDIWALGVILYELVAGPGKTPFEGETLMALTTNVLVKPPVPLKKHLPDVPAAFEAAVIRCLDKNRDQRWPDVAAFAAAIAPFTSPRGAAYAERVARVRGARIDARPPARGARPAPASPAPVSVQESEPALNVPGMRLVVTTAGATSQPAGAPQRPRRGAVAIGATAALVILAVGGLGAWRWRTSSNAPALPGLVVGASGSPPIAAPPPSSAPRPSPPLMEAAPSVTPASPQSTTLSATAGATSPLPSTTLAPGAPKGKASPRTPLAPAQAPVQAPEPASDIFSRGTRTR